MNNNKLFILPSTARLAKAAIASTFTDKSDEHTSFINGLTPPSSAIFFLLSL